ncbi:Carboxylesterase type B [Penicillium atrosanguineum]|nr:Carboxylesterase type B [Penicillium atrosanguineum]
MRYAKAPVHDLRFRSPEDPDANKDCLFINVWKPANASSDSSLPVWLFIQGGGYANNANANYNGSEVVEQSGHDIVFVNFNYRVGALGFLASEAVRQNGSLNAGLLDQRKALHWVKKYIRHFGGNPDHIVIHGDSSGSGSVAHHLTAYGGRNDNLFIGAVAESTFWPTQRTVAEMEFQYQRFVKDVGCDEDEESLSCLRSAHIDTIQTYNVDEPFPGGSDDPAPLWYFLPIVDDDLVHDRLYSSFEQGKLIHVPLIVTDDDNEGTDFAYNATSQSEVAQFMKNNYPGLSHVQLDTISKAYPRMDPLPKHTAYFPSAAAAYGEATFTCPGNHMAASMSRYFSSDKVWNYRFNVQDPTEIANGKGVPHVFDLPAIFGVGETNEPTYSYANINSAIIPITMDYYLSFIKALNPNEYRNEDAPMWNPWGDGQGQRLKLETNSTNMEIVPKQQTERCEMWMKLAPAMEH